jgi:putative hydrolase
MIVDSDGHGPDDLLTEEKARRIALGAGIPQSQLKGVLIDNPRLLLARIRR